MAELEEILRAYRAKAIKLIQTAPKGVCSVCRYPESIPYLAELTTPEFMDVTLAINLCSSCTEVWNIKAEECERLGYLDYCGYLVNCGRQSTIPSLNGAIIETNKQAATNRKQDKLDLNNPDTAPF